MNFSVIEPYAPMFISGLSVTLEVTGAALVLAFALGFLIAVLKVLPCKPLRVVLDFYTSIFRGIPLIVLLFIAYFATPDPPPSPRPCAAASRALTAANTTPRVRWASPITS